MDLDGRLQFALTAFVPMAKSASNDQGTARSCPTSWVHIQVYTYVYIYIRI